MGSTLCPVRSMVLLADRQGEAPAGRHAGSGERRGGGPGLGACSGPGGFDGPLDEARGDAAGHPQRDGEPRVGGHQLEAEVRLAEQHATPGGPQQGDEVGPQRGRPFGIDDGRAEHLDESGAPGHPPVLGAP